MKLQSRSESETKKIGRKLGKKLKRGDVICLYGELGSGKTTFVKGIASALGIDERDITSASFTIIAEYDSDIPFYHIDLYRIGTDEVSGLGLHEYLGSEGISVIEWAERAEKEIPESSIKINLHYTDENSREIVIKGTEL
jgi:tRNA threonylcarbamoyladenosine biosynthesis protein TsaE